MDKPYGISANYGWWGNVLTGERRKLDSADPTPAWNKACNAVQWRGPATIQQPPPREANERIVWQEAGSCIAYLSEEDARAAFELWRSQHPEVTVSKERCEWIFQTILRKEAMARGGNA
jgi:hypothetical protein